MYKLKHNTRSVKSFSKKEWSICKHCRTNGHIIDNYKFHGIPPKYKPKPKPQSMADQVIYFDNTSSVHSPFLLTDAQYQ